MKSHKSFFGKTIVLACGLALVTPAFAATTITTFDNFNLDGVFANWASATIVSGPTAYSITASGYGSGFEDINPNVNALGETTVELTLTLSGGSGPISGPIVSLVDADGTFYNYAWYGQTAGSYTLTAPVNSPSFISSAGSVPGLDLSNLDFFHLQDDPGSYSGTYTISFENLSLTGVPEPSSFALLGFGGLALALARRRVR
jgi:hypothetical protein